VTDASQIYKIALVASNGDTDIAAMLESLYAQNRLQKHAVSIGDGESFAQKSSVSFVEGYSFPCGFLSPYFATDPEHKEVVYGSMKEGTRNAYVFLTD